MPAKATIITAAALLTGATALVWWKQGQGSVRPAVAPAATNAARPSPGKNRPSTRWDKLTDTSVPWQTRVATLRRLDAGTLTEADTDALYALLAHRPAPGQEEAWWVVANEIMEQMRKQAIGRERLTPALLGIIRDTGAPEVLRDYAVQHLGQWITPRGPRLGLPHEQDPEHVRETARTLAALVTDPALAHTSVPGTTLRVIADMSAGGLDEKTLGTILAPLHPWLRGTIGGESGASKITRISAINAVATLRRSEYRPSVLALATTTGTDPSLRLNSIAALGHIGTREDIPVLRELAATDTPFRHAARAALARLTKDTSQ